MLKTKRQTGLWLCYLTYAVTLWNQMTTVVMLFILESVAHSILTQWSGLWFCF